MFKLSVTDTKSLFCVSELRLKKLFEERESLQDQVMLLFKRNNHYPTGVCCVQVCVVFRCVLCSGVCCVQVCDINEVCVVFRCVLCSGVCCVQVCVVFRCVLCSGVCY